jgi:amidase
MDELLDSTLQTIGEAIKSKRVKSTDVVRGFLDRVEKVNPQLNALVYSTAEQAMKLADRADKALQNQEAIGKLHGIPITIKDSLDTKDAITTWGTLGRKDFRPGRDATVVARLRDQGAILMGKTNTPEFTLSFQTSNLVYGATNNPFDLSRTPGGSSGGAAALIAAGATPFDIGTDTGGSIRLPSHFCGITGIKPTTGRVPCTGNALPSYGLLAPLSQPGPMARYVDDLSFVLGIIAGPDHQDPHCIPGSQSTWSDIQNLRVAFHTDNGICTPDKDIINTIGSVVELLSEETGSATEARPTGLEMAGFVFSRVFSADNGEMVQALLEDCRTEMPSPRLQQSLDRPSQPLSPQEFAQVINLWDNYRSTMLGFFDDFDILISPVNAHTALKLDEMEDLSAYTYTSAYNLTGWPGVVIRAGQDHSGLPIGVQILAAPFREDRCLAVAKWLEEKLPDFKPPTTTSA